MGDEIIRWQSDGEFYTDEGCYINEMLNLSIHPDVSIARARVQPRSTTRWHRLHNIWERYVILQGSGLVEVGNSSPQHVSYGDVVLIPPDTPQRISNIGETDLIFLAVCTPRFRQRAYEDMEISEKNSRSSEQTTD